MAIYTQYGSKVVITGVREVTYEYIGVEKTAQEAVVMYENGNKGSYPVRFLVADGGDDEIREAIQNAQSIAKNIKDTVEFLMIKVEEK